MLALSSVDLLQKTMGIYLDGVYIVVDTLYIIHAYRLYIYIWWMFDTVYIDDGGGGGR